jgi:hypothetical protein
MKKLIKKFDSLYEFFHTTYTYKIGYCADLFAVMFMNILWNSWFSAPVIALVSQIQGVFMTNPTHSTQEEMDRLMEAEYWNKRAQEESDYFAHLLTLQEREE